MAPLRVVRVERVIPAAAGEIFDLLADPARHAEFDGSGSIQRPQEASSQRLSLGATFLMRMHLGFDYVTRNHVIEFEEGRRIAWHHFARFVWRYELTAAEGGTLVAESFDYSVAWGVLIEPLGWPERNRRSMDRTLERLESVVTAAKGPPPS